jgi:hypothetical protein
MIRRDLNNQYYGRPTTGVMMGSTNFSAGAGDMWKRDPMRNPSLQEATEDDILMAENFRRHELAQKLLKREEAAKAKRQNDMLQAMLGKQAGSVNLFEKPNSLEEADLQDLIQNDVDAGTRGWNASVGDARRTRKEGFENMALAMKLRDQALDRSKFVNQRENQRDNLDLDAARLNQQGKYRGALIAQRQQQMRMDYARSGDQDYQREAKLALELVKDGMSPEEVNQLFKLDPRDATLLNSYGAMLDDEDAAADAEQQPMLDYLNDMELGMRTERAAPSAPSAWQRALGALSGGAFGARNGGTPELIGPPATGRAAMNPASGAEFDKLRLEAAKQGFTYNPNTGFEMPGMVDDYAQADQPAQSSRARLKPGLPVVRTPAEAARLPKGTKFQNLEGRVFIR